MMKQYGCFLVGLVMSSVVMANPITITNSSRSSFTVSVNGTCLGAYGIIKPMSAATADENKLKNLCKNNSAHCLAEVYNSTTCSGDLAGNYYFHTKNGLSGEHRAVPPFNMFIRKYGVTFTQS